MTLRRALLLWCGIVLFSSGCYLQKRRDRQPIDAGAVRSVTKGTTIDAVGKLLGSPNEVIWSNGVTTPVDVNLGAGVINTFVAGGTELYPRAYHYRYTAQKTSGFTVIVFSMVSYDTKYDDVFVFFDEKGLVTHVGVSLNGDTVSYSPFGS